MSATYLALLNALDHSITIPKAAQLIKRFDAERINIINGAFNNADPFTTSQTFKRSQIQDLLNQHGCVALRAYFGMYDNDPSVPNEEKGKIVLVLCGVDEDGNDLNLLPGSTATGQVLLQRGQLCPPVCSAKSQINNL